MGSESAAVTSVHTVTLGARSRPLRARHTTFDRPFGVVIFADVSGVPLCTAWQARLPRST